MSFSKSPYYLVGGWMPENYWQTSPFEELFERMADERQGGSRFIPADRRYNTIRGNLTTGAQEVIGKIFEHYHDKDKDDEISDIIFNAYSNAIGMLPMEPSPSRKVEATKRFWDQIIISLFSMIYMINKNRWLLKAIWRNDIL